MELNEAIGLFQTQIVNMDTIWAYYSTATLAVLGFTVASEKATRSRNEIRIVQLGYVLFAIGNAFSISASQNSLIELGKLVISAGGSMELANAFEVWQVVAFHILVTTLVLVLIEATYRYNRSLNLSVAKDAPSS